MNTNTQNTDVPVPAIERFHSCLERGDLSALEEAWMEEISSAGGGALADLEPFLMAADALQARGERERTLMLLDLLLPACAKGPPSQALEVLQRMVLASPRRADFRTAFVGRFRETHGAGSLADIYLGISGLEGAADPVKPMALLDRLLMFQPGRCVFHPSGWGVGVVESVDPVLRQAVVDLDKKRHHRVDLKAIAQILEPLADDHFLAIGRDGGVRLREMAESSPVDLVGVILSSFGNPLELKGIKARLVPDIIPAEGWSKWWNRVKALLRDSGYYRVADRAPYAVERMRKSVSYEDELLRQFEAGDFAERLSIARKHARDRNPGFPRLRQRAVVELRAMVDRERGTRALEAASVLERIAGGEPGAEGAILGVLRASTDLAGDLLAMEGPDEKRRALEVLKEAAPDSWTETALTVLSRGDDVHRDAAARVLEGSSAEGRAAAVVAEAIRVPRNFPELFAWACRGFLEGSSSPLFEPFKAYPPLEVVGRILDALDNLGMRSERDGKALVRDTLGRVRALLAADDGRYFREVIRSLPRGDARAVYGRVLSSGGLSEPLRVKLLEVLMAEVPDITRAEVRPIWEEDFIYTTEAGLSRKQAEFREITEDKLPKNFQDIGRAAAFGDLSENAEYTSALEERDRLTKRATEMKAQLDKVRLIRPDMLRAGEVYLGARVRLKNHRTGQVSVYDILGPWDGGPEDGVLNYRSPLAITLMGKKVGDEVEAQLPGGVERYRVEGVDSAFVGPSPGSPRST